MTSSMLYVSCSLFKNVLLFREDSLHVGVHHLHPGGHGFHHHHHRAGQVDIVLRFSKVYEISLLFRREYAESWRKMQELRAQIQAQLKLADTLKKLGDHAGEESNWMII